MNWLTTNIIATFLLPPLSLLLLFALGMVLSRHRPRTARMLQWTAFVLLWLSATPFIAEGGLHLLEQHTSPWKPGAGQAEAIVILGSGSYFNAPEYGGEDTVSELVLPRLRYGARLQRATGKPVLVCGGRPHGSRLSEAQQMRTVLQQDFGVPVRWTENTSRNTGENARHAYRLLHRHGIGRIYLVTHAWHMPRAAASFRRAGFEVVEAPTAFTTRKRVNLLAFLPRARSLLDSSILLHESIGLAWYRVNGD